MHKFAVTAQIRTTYNCTFCVELYAGTNPTVVKTLAILIYTYIDLSTVSVYLLVLLYFTVNKDFTIRYEMLV